ncbi:MAG: Uma2 family endonuclease [Pseudomonadota bacterium]|nr:Uma2 family endonuclease [Pseudomonadota bacterium]
MSLQPKTGYTFDDYLAAERAALETRHEYVAGDVFAMTGATENHNIIVANIITALTLQMRGRPCRVYAKDMKVRVDASDAGTYPDVTAICGERGFYDGRRDVPLNPSVIIEVLSDSTEAYDRGDKFALYRALPSLREYLLVSQHVMRAELYVHQADGHWMLGDHGVADNAVPLASIDCSLSLADVYDKVEFSARISD